jgi:hypothetical protein
VTYGRFWVKTDASRYFKPKFLPSYGTFQDGGLKYNNPVRPGLREVRRIWPDGDCDIVLSIGTGFEQKLLSPVASNVRNLLQDGALARLYRASMESLSLNGQISWEDHWLGLDEDVKKQHYRLNLPLSEKEPNIDSVDKMQYLYDQVQHHLGDIKGISRAFMAVSFFFELDGPLVRDGRGFRCRGSILSRSPDSRDLVQNLTARFPYAQFYVQETPLGFISLKDICEDCGRFQKAVDFHVRHPSDRVNISLAFNRLYRASISAFPKAVEWFVDRQKLNARFGQADHRSRIRPPGDASCSCELERRLDGSGPQTSVKKRRLVAEQTRSKRRRL